MTSRGHRRRATGVDPDERQQPSVVIIGSVSGSQLNFNTKQKVYNRPAPAQCGPALVFCCICIAALTAILIMDKVPAKLPPAVDRCRQHIIQFYNDTARTIPAHPLLPSRTLDIDQFFIKLELAKELPSQTEPTEPLKLSEGNSVLDKVQTVPLDSWKDIFNQKKVRQSRVILSGGAGYGKSTLLTKIVSNWAESGEPARFKLVFLLRLRNVRTTGCLIDAIFNQILPTDTSLTRQEMKNVLDVHQDEIAFLLDGFDEFQSSALNSPKGIYRIQDILHHRALVNSFVLVTTRPHKVDSIQKGYPHYAHVKTLGFTADNRNKFIKYQFSNDVQSGEALLSCVESNLSLQSLSTIPLISQMICIIWKNQGSLPNKMTELYTDFAKVLVKRRLGEDQWQQRMDTLLNGLGRVALDGLLDADAKRQLFEPEEFQSCGTCLEDGTNSGFLQRENFTSGVDVIEVVVFYHLSFQEYCAAYYLVNLLEDNADVFHTKVGQLMRDADLLKISQMETMLRFCCGRSHLAAGVILEHVRMLSPRDKDVSLFQVSPTSGLNRLMRLLLFEAGSSQLVRKVPNQSHEVFWCKTSEDILSLQFYLRSVHEELLNELHFDFECQSYDQMKVIFELLLSVDIGSVADVKINYQVSKHAKKEFRYLTEKLKLFPKDTKFILVGFVNDDLDPNVVSKGLEFLIQNQLMYRTVGPTHYLQGRSLVEPDPIDGRSMKCVVPFGSEPSCRKKVP